MQLLKKTFDETISLKINKSFHKVRLHVVVPGYTISQKDAMRNVPPVYFDKTDNSTVIFVNEKNYLNFFQSDDVSGALEKYLKKIAQKQSGQEHVH